MIEPDDWYDAERNPIGREVWNDAHAWDASKRIEPGFCYVDGPVRVIVGWSAINECWIGTLWDGPTKVLTDGHTIAQALGDLAVGAYHVGIVLGSDISDLLDDIVQWQRRTFPQGTVESVVSHLAEEVQELVAEPRSAEELADCLILIVGAADRAGIDLWQAVRDKHARNQRRKWGTADEKGVVHHIEESE